jgi:hypothetical protein
MDNKKIHIIWSQSSQSTTRSGKITENARQVFPTLDIINHPIDDTLTSTIENIVGSPASKIVFFDPDNTLDQDPARTSLIQTIRQTRKDIFLIGFNATSNASEDEQYIRGLRLLKQTSSNLVLASDTTSRMEMIIAPEEARYHVGTDTSEILRNLVDMTKLRSHLTFTRSTIIWAEWVAWNSPLVYPSLRTVVDFCISASAYKPFMGSTAWHFAVKLDEQTFLTSQRKTDFNNLPALWLVRVITDGPDNVLAYGWKPSVWGQSQRIIFRENPQLDCIVHFHCPLKKGSSIPVMSQREFECGSHECGQNTANWLRHLGDGIYAVYLDNHGPNIVFNHDIDPDAVIAFIGANFDLTQKTGWYVDLWATL